VWGLPAVQPQGPVVQAEREFELPVGGELGGVWKVGTTRGENMRIYTRDGKVMRQRTRTERLWKRITHGIGCIGMAWSIWRKPWRAAESDDPFDNIALSTAIVVAWGIWK